MIAALLEVLGYEKSLCLLTDDFVSAFWSNMVDHIYFFGFIRLFKIEQCHLKLEQQSNKFHTIICFK